MTAVCQGRGKGEEVFLTKPEECTGRAEIRRNESDSGGR